MAQYQDTILQWLGGAYCPPGQSPLQLSSEIESFETDFSSGYVFGHILSHYGICESLNTFVRKNNKEAKVHNFYQVEDALRRLKVSFDAKLVHKVMSEEPGASIHLLNLMKRGIDNHFSKSNLSVTNLKQRVVDQKVKHIRDLAVKLPSIHKEYGVEGPTIKSQKYDRIEKKLLKFEVAKANIDRKATNDFIAECNMLKSMQQQKRQEALQKMQENKSFMKEWNETGFQNWQKNQDTRASEIARSKYFEDREIKIYKDSLTKELNHNTEDMQLGIQEFHENLRKLGVEENITIQDAIKRQEQKKGIPPGQIQNFSYAATMNKIKETKNNNEFAGKERDRRNRKMKVDQIKIQEMLDTQKKEELILQKILAKQTQEQHAAYTRERNSQCKAIIFNNRVKKAEEFNSKRALETAQIEKKMREEAEAIESERQLEHEDNKGVLKTVRRDEKYKRRRINVEIASEIIDLIMDITDSAFQFQEDNKDQEDVEDRLINKPLWREWMGIFADGKKVSEANIVIQQEQTTETIDSDKSPIAKMLGIGQEIGHPSQIIEKVKNEGIYTDFLQYLTISGQMNMQLYANDKWNNFMRVVDSDLQIQEKELNFSYLNSESIPQNIELAKFVEKLYVQIQAQNETMQMLHMSSVQLSNYSQLAKSGLNSISKMDENIDEVKKAIEQQMQQLPLWHTLKLCVIGKASSGKKTTAQMIKDEFGDQFTVFNMSDVLREALAYVQVEKKEENHVETTNKAAPKKGGGKPAQEANVVDPFAGRDTAAYKEIATLLLKELQVSTGQEKLPGKETDLVSLIKDDNLLVNLFLQKLKLTFHHSPPSKDEQEATMRTNLEKEKELRQLLVETLEAEQSQPDLHNKDPKKGKGAAAKNTNVKSSKDIQQEIAQLLSVEKNGWVLVDFPRDVNQAKLLENHFHGYRSASDQPKPADQVNFEVWSKFADPEITSKELYFDAQPSCFDSVILLSTSKEECLRRCNNRKIDPQTQNVYHMDDNPPPTNDAKLTDRLVPNFGFFTSEHEMIAQLDRNHLLSTDNEPFLINFYNEFGMLDQETSQGIASFVKITVDEKLSKQEVHHDVQTKISEILKFKQITKDRQYQQLRNQIKAEEAEAEATKEAESTIKVEGVESKEQIDQTQTAEENQLELPSKDQEIEDLEIQNRLAQSRFSEVATSEQMSKKSRSSLAKKQKKKEYSREYKIQIWEEMVCSYFRDGMMTINSIKKLNESVVNQLNVSQTDFITFLERVDEKQQLVIEFVNNFNQFAVEFPDLRQDDQTKEELSTRVSLLSNNLWKSIINKKDESIKEIQRQAEEGWAVQEMRTVCKLIAQMIEIEIKKFNTVFQITLEEDPPVELDAEIFTKKLIERGVSAYDQENKKSPILNQLVAKQIQSMEELFLQAQKEFNVGSHPFLIMLQQERNIFNYRLALLQAWGLTLIEEISVYSSQVYQLMDDWVIEAVSQENNNSQHVLNAINEFIRSSEMQMNEYDYSILPTSLFNFINLKIYDLGAQPLYLQRFSSPKLEVEDLRFNQEQLNTLFEQIRRAVGEKGSFDLLDQQTFVNLMMLAFRQHRIPTVWKYLNFDKIQIINNRFSGNPLPSMSIGDNSPTQFQSEFTKSMGKNFQLHNNRSWLDWKKMLTHFILLNSTIPTDQQLQDYENELRKVSGDQELVTVEQFTKVKAWFDSVEGRPDSKLLKQWIQDIRQQQLASEYEDEVISEDEVYSKLDEVRLTHTKNLLFNTFRDKVGQDKLYISQFIGALSEISRYHQDKTFSEALFD